MKLAAIHDTYVVVHSDKASNNVVFFCKDVLKRYTDTIYSRNGVNQNNVYFEKF